MSTIKFKQKVEKFNRNNQHFDYLFAKGMHSIEIADHLIHILLDFMYEGFKNQYPNESKKKIELRMRDVIKNQIKIKNLSRKMSKNGI